MLCVCLGPTSGRTPFPLDKHLFELNATNQTLTIFLIYVSKVGRKAFKMCLLESFSKAQSWNIKSFSKRSKQDSSNLSFFHLYVFLSPFQIKFDYSFENSHSDRFMSSRNLAVSVVNKLPRVCLTNQLKRNC